MSTDQGDAGAPTYAAIVAIMRGACSAAAPDDGDDPVATLDAERAR